MAVVNSELLGHLIDVAPRLGRAFEITVIDQHQIEFALFFAVKEFALIAQVGQKIAVTGDIRIEPLKLADQRTFGFLVLRIELADFRVQQIAEIKRSRAGAISIPVLPLRERVEVRGGLSGKSTPRFGFGTRNVTPANFLRIDKNAALDSLVFAWLHHLFHVISAMYPAMPDIAIAASGSERCFLREGS